MSTHAEARAQGVAFGPFHLFPSQKLLLESGSPVRLGSRAMELLIALVDRSGEVVSKNELISYAWPNTFVEESALRVHIAALRKILGDRQPGIRYIANVAGRGYSFIAPVSRIDINPRTAESGKAAVSNLPAPISRAVGRTEVIEAIAAQVGRRRLVTIVGPGGVGKTTVALAIAERLIRPYSGRVSFVDLSAIAEPSLVASAVAASAGIPMLVNDPVQSLATLLRDTHMLLLLDNCEHVIVAVAQIVEHIRRTAPDVSILATSREPLLAEGESVYNLAPLPVPPSSPSLRAKEALAFAAVELFVERATSIAEGFELSDRNAGLVADICRRLDGVPLAIEVVAARVGVLGIEALVEDDEERLLRVQGRRTASMRHRSLQATLDWSYRLLTPVEQAIMRRLAVFRGSFSAESARAVVSGTGVRAAEVPEGLLSLVAKSLLATDVGGATIRYRQLHVTRVHASEKLTESGELADTMRRHAEHHDGLLQAAMGDWEDLDGPEWRERYGVLMDDVRAALEWAYSSAGDLDIATRLMAAAAPFGFQMYRVDEFKRRAELSLEHLKRRSPALLISELHIRTMMLILLLLHNIGADDATTMLSQALRVADQIGIARHQVEAYTARAVFQLELGDHEAAIAAAHSLVSLAKNSDDPLANLVADRVAAQVYHFAGEHRRARMLAERVLTHPARVVPLIILRTTIDRRASMRVVLARIAWLEGRADAAEQLANEAVEHAATTGPFGLCQALGFAACPIAFWRGDLEAARAFTEKLLTQAERFDFKRWIQLGKCFRSAMTDVSPKPLSSEVGGTADPQPSGVLQRALLCTITGRWLDAATMRRAEKGQCDWSVAEILRVGAVQMLQPGGVGLNITMAKLQRALAIASEQQALAWELRVTMSLVQLWRQRGMIEEAERALTEVYKRFSEGHKTADLKAARELMEDLRKT